MADSRSFDWRGLRPAFAFRPKPAVEPAAVAGHRRPRGLPRSSLARTLSPPEGASGRLKGLAGHSMSLSGVTSALRSTIAAGAGAMLVACRLAGLSALEERYPGVRARVQFGADPSKDHAAG